MAKRKTAPQKSATVTEPKKASKPNVAATTVIVNRQQLARLMGVHPDTVTHSAKAGMPVLDAGGRGKESRYDAVDCLTWHRANIDKNGKDAAQTRALTASAELNELKLAQQRGELISVTEAISAGQKFVMGWRAKVLGLARRMVQLGAIPPASEAAAADACRDLLFEISQWKTVEDCDEARAS